MNMKNIDYLFVHVPKRANYYKPMDEFMLVNYIPVGILMLADLLEKQNHSSKVIHVGLEYILDNDFSIIDWIKDKDIKVIGMPIHWHYQSYDAIDVAQKIKRARPDIHINLGGFTASRFAEEILEQFPEIDSVTVGDGERTAIQLIDSVKNSESFSEVQNLVWRDNDKIVDNGISFVAKEEELKGLDYTNFSLMIHADDYVKNFSVPLFWLTRGSIAYNRKIHFKGSNFYPLPVGRGCSVNCTFCGGSRDALEKINGRRVPVFRPVDDVVQSVIGAKKAGYNSLNVCFDPYPAKYQYWKELFGKIKEQNIDIDMFFECWGLPVPEFIDAFADTFKGERSAIAISAESGSDTVRCMNKGLPYDNEQLFKTLDYMQKKNINTYMYFTLGLANETANDARETKELMETINNKYKKIIKEILLVPIQLEPGSPMFEDPEKHGIETSRSCFMDFYTSHGSMESSPYVDLCYTSPSLTGEKLSVDEFSQYILEQRCKDFCIIAPTIFGKQRTKLGKPLCNLRNKMWKQKGYGSVPEERAHFQ